MFTTNQLYQLGYSEKPNNIEMHDGSTDSKHDDFENRTHLVNLNTNVNEGHVTVVFPPINMQPQFQMDDSAEFLNWQNNYYQKK